MKHPIDSLQPSQLYINAAKLHQVMKNIREKGVESLRPVPIKLLDGRLVMTDGHTRGVALLKLGHTEIETVWEDEELSWDEYRNCVSWCDEEGIHSLRDLVDRIIPDKEYKVKWLQRCKEAREKMNAQGRSE